jgi:hypothetical protein
MVWLLLAAVCLTACGGGAGSGSAPGGSGTSPQSDSLTFSLLDAGGRSITSFPVGTQATVSVRFVDRNGAALRGATIRLTVNTAVTSVLPATAATLTDTNGQARFTLTGLAEGVDNLIVNATTSDGTRTASGQMSYQVLGSSPTQLQLSLTDPDGAVIPNTLSPGDRVNLIARLVDNGSPVANQRVRFALDTSVAGFLRLDTTSVLTDANGFARAQVTAVSGATSNFSTSVAVSTNYRNQVLTASQTLNYLSPVPAIGSVTIDYPIAGQPISYRGSAGMVINVVDVSRTGSPPYTEPLQLVLTSTCFERSLARFSDTAPTLDGNGRAAVTYTDLGCGQNDILTVSIAGSTASARSFTVRLSTAPTVPPGTPAIVQFLDATPTALNIAGSGGTQTSVVRFSVLDAGGNPLASQAVNFSLGVQSPSIATLATPNGVTDGQGVVSATVAAGTVGGPVTVTAALASNPLLAAQSSQLFVSTRIPHQNGFSISATVLNPEFLDVDGQQTSLTVSASDRYGNPVPDGTPVTFKTEGGIGVIRDGSGKVGSCTLVNSQCTVTLTAAGNRSVLTQKGDSLNGRQHIIAFAVGEDSFVDNDANGVLSSGDTFPPPGFYRYGDPFIDSNENGMREAGEEFVGYLPGSYNDGRDGGADLRYHGLACQSASGLCSANNRRYVFDDQVITWSGSTASFAVTLNGVSVSPGSTQILPAPSLVAGTCVAAEIPLTVRITDRNGRIMPADTTLALAASKGGAFDVAGFTVPNSNAAAAVWSSIFTPGLATVGCSNAPATITLTASTPRGVVTTFSFNVQ